MIVRLLLWPFAAVGRGLGWALAAAGRILIWPFAAVGRGLKWALWTSPGAVRLWSWAATIGASLLVAFEANAARQIVVGIFSLIFYGLRDVIF